MRVLIVHERYRQRGGEDMLFDTESAMLEARGCHVERLVADNCDIDENRRPLGLAVNTLWSNSGRRRVREAVERFRPHIVHIHNWFPLLSPAIHGAVRARGVPVVQTLHNFRLMCLNGLHFRDGSPCEDCAASPSQWRGVLRRCYRDDVKASAVTAAMTWLHHRLGTWRRDVDLFLALSEFSRARFIAAGLPAERIAVKNNSAPDPGEQAASWAHRRSGALVIGRLSPEKGIEDLVGAWRRMGHRLGVIGDGPLAATLRSNASDEVDFAGWCDSARISQMLSKTALVCLPSRCYEQFPLVVAEAAAHGVPVLASDLGAMQTLIRDGETGFRVRAGDGAAWRDAARALLDNPQGLAVMGEKARRIYLAQYSPEAVTDALLAHYTRLIESAR